MAEIKDSDLNQTARVGPDVQRDDSALHIANISKSFRNVVALDDVSLNVNEGEVVGLVGENGAGKSTLLKILTGVQEPDQGELFTHGEKQTFTGPLKAAKEGISLVHQEQDIVSNLSGAENLFLGREGDLTPYGYVNKERMIDEAQQHLESLGINIDLSLRAGDLSFNERQLLEIARAFMIAKEGATETPIIMLDEPTAGLEEESRDLLFSLINDLRDRASFIFVSHELDEVIEISDRIYVLKDGQLVNEVSASETTQEVLRTSMVGRSLSDDYYLTSKQLSNTELGEEVLAVDELLYRDEVGPFSLSLREGEILGVVGVDGSGKERLGRMLYGDITPTSGSVTVLGQEVFPDSPSTMKTTGMGYIPKDRKNEGLLLYQPVRTNTSIAIVDKMMGKLPLLDIGLEKRETKEAVEKLDIKTPSIETLVRKLSGGNQQKVVLGRWFANESSILVMDNVTRGVDVGAKEDVYELCREFTRQGISMIFIADELQEVIGMANRIAVMYKGEIVDIVDAPPEDKPTEKELIELMV